MDAIYISNSALHLHGSTDKAILPVAYQVGGIASVEAMTQSHTVTLSPTTSGVSSRRVCSALVNERKSPYVATNPQSSLYQDSNVT